MGASALSQDDSIDPQQLTERVRRRAGGPDDQPRREAGSIGERQTRRLDARQRGVRHDLHSPSPKLMLCVRTQLVP